jgi:hypothetical protein
VEVGGWYGRFFILSYQENFDLQISFKGNLQNNRQFWLRNLKDIWQNSTFGVLIWG